MIVTSSSPDPGAPTPAEMGELSAAAVAASRNDRNANPRQLINAGLINQRKARIAYENGYTIPASAQTLLANAQRRDYNHRRTLSRNVIAATQQARPSSSCAECRFEGCRMTIWELRCANIDDYSMVVPSELDLLDGLFEIDGQPLDWMSIPIVEYADSRGRGKQKRPIADVASIGHGAFVLSSRAVEVLGPFLAQFGQLLEVQTAGGAEFRHLFNVTNLVKCVDAERSEKSASGPVRAEVFYDINVPRSPAVFKDPLTAAVRIYTNDPGRELIERLATEAGLTGIECGEPRRY